MFKSFSRKKSFSNICRILRIKHRGEKNPIKTCRLIQLSRQNEYFDQRNHIKKKENSDEYISACIEVVRQQYSNEYDNQ